MRRSLISITLAVALLTLAGSPALAVSANINPATQSHAHNVSSSWTGSWTGRISFEAIFWYGDGTGLDVVTNNRSRNYSHGYSPCPGDATTYYQQLQVWDNGGHGSPLYASSTSSAHENAGTPC